MLVVMQQGATDEQIQHVIDRLVDLDFNVHRSTGVIHTVLGGVGGNPWIWVQFLHTDGEAASDEILIGRCVQSSK